MGVDGQLNSKKSDPLEIWSKTSGQGVNKKYKSTSKWTLSCTRQSVVLLHTFTLICPLVQWFSLVWTHPVVHHSLQICCFLPSWLAGQDFAQKNNSLTTSYNISEKVAPDWWLLSWRRTCRNSLTTGRTLNHQRASIQSENIRDVH